MLAATIGTTQMGGSSHLQYGDYFRIVYLFENYFHSRLKIPGRRSNAKVPASSTLKAVRPA